MAAEAIGCRSQRVAFVKVTLALPLATISLVINFATAATPTWTNGPEDSFFCGTSWGNVNADCSIAQHCPSGSDDDCGVVGQSCFAFTECDIKLGHGNNAPPPSPPTDHNHGGNAPSPLTFPSPDPTDHYFCGAGYQDAVDNCRQHCPSGNSHDCPQGQLCYFNLPTCDARTMPTPAPIPNPPSASVPSPPSPSDDPSDHFFCGFGFSNALESCAVHCPGGNAAECPPGQLCYFNVMSCDARTMPTKLPTHRPTVRVPTKPPTNAPIVTQINTPAEPSATPPTNPTVLCSDVSGWIDAEGDGCSWYENYDPGCIDWGTMGGSVGLTANEACCECGGGTAAVDAPSPPSMSPPTSQTIDTLPSPTKGPTRRPSKPPVQAALPYPSHDARDHYFCGFGIDDANANCEVHCPSGSSADCPYNNICYFGTTCDARTLAPTDAPTDAPTFLPTFSARPSQAPTDEPTKEPTEAPTKAPTEAPTTTPTNAPTARPTALPSEAPSANPIEIPSGVPSRTPSEIPTISPVESPSEVPSLSPTLSPTSRPTRSPIKSDDPANFFYCGTDWNDVVTNCRMRCPGGSDTECPSGEFCFAFTSCTAEKTQPPSKSPTDTPSKAPTAAPTGVPTKASHLPTPVPTMSPVTQPPTEAPNTAAPTKAFETSSPTRPPTSHPTKAPSKTPSLPPTPGPSPAPSGSSSASPSSMPSLGPSVEPTSDPTSSPTASPTASSPTLAPTMGPCDGEVCSDTSYCRSPWGFCGPGPGYCNSNAIWSPNCGIPTKFPSEAPTSLPTNTPTTVPTDRPTSSAPTSSIVTTLVPTKSPTQVTSHESGNGQVEPLVTSAIPTPTPTHSSHNPTNAPTSAPSNDPMAARCTGEACTVAGHCRSKYGYCGSGYIYCNDDSSWIPDCSAGTPTGKPTTAVPSRRPTPKPTAAPASTTSATTFGETSSSTTFAPAPLLSPIPTASPSLMNGTKAPSAFQSSENSGQVPAIPSLTGMPSRVTTYNSNTPPWLSTWTDKNAARKDLDLMHQCVVVACTSLVGLLLMY